MNAAATKSISPQIRRAIKSIPEGEVFDYSRFGAGPARQAATIKALSRLVQSGELVRLEKGKYYKPRNTRFGKLRPPEPAVLQALTTRANRIEGYLTGTALYNKMGLTTQVPTVISIARNTRLPVKELNGYTIKYVIRPFKFSKKDIPFLQLLDACKDIQAIPDAAPANVLTALLKRLEALSEEERKQLARLALLYNPATRALVGAMLQQLFPQSDLAVLRQSLNPLTKYKLPFAAALLTTAPNWNIE